MWLEAPASSPAPHLDGHHVSPEAEPEAALAPPAVVWAWATVIGAEPNLPKAAPAAAAVTTPAVFMKVRRSGCSTLPAWVLESSGG